MRTAWVTLFLATALWLASAATNDQGPQPYLTSHFVNWLNANGYDSFNFDRTDISGGSFGGKQDDDDSIVNRPVIFFHGNSDRAMGTPNDKFNGFYDSINYFMSQGYKESELYATTWGPANPDLATDQYHSFEYLNYLRNFVEAVLDYTQADKIDIIAHSMGVTLGRKVIKGGTGTDTKDYNLGESLASRVNTFLGIAGGNLGLTPCYGAIEYPTCGAANGFYPGLTAISGPSTYLADLNSKKGREGDYVFSMLSTADDLIMYGDIVWGQYTSQIPNEDDSKIYDDLTHMELKSKTTVEQLKIITNQEI